MPFDLGQGLMTFEPTGVRPYPVLRVLGPAPRRRWRSLVANDSDALPEHAPEWVDAICHDGRFVDASRLYGFEDGRAFVLPMVRRSGVAGLGGHQFSYPAAWGIGGLVGPDQDASVVRAVLDDLRRDRALRTAIRPDPTKAALWSAAADPATTVLPRRAHVADLSGGFDTVQQRMSKATRKYVRRAERAGVELQIESGPALLPEYWMLNGISIARWAARQHEPLALARWRAGRRDPRSKLSAMADALGDGFVVALARVDGVPAYASIMLLGRTAHVTRSAMDVDRVGSTKAGSLVHWHLMKLAVERGCTRYHLGESGDSTSLAQFKEGFGAEPMDYAEYRLERLPITRVDRLARTTVKRLIGFRDT